MTQSDFERRAADLRRRYDALAAAQPGLRARNMAARLAVSEAELVAAQCGGLLAQPLAGEPQALFRELGGLGRVMALTRNDWCVHERKGCYLDIHADGPVGLVLGPDIDLRMFFSCWASAWSVREGPRRSLQFFDASGTAVHKVYALEDGDLAAFDAFEARHRGDRRWPQPQAWPADTAADRVGDPAALRAAWLALTDTHQFFPMLRKFKVTRQAALRAAGQDLAQQVEPGALEAMLQSAAASGLPLMCFVANRGMVQIHTGPVHELRRTGPWYNVLDPDFNLHLDTGAVASLWVVNKPTDDGWVTSLEAYAGGGELIVQFFGARKPGKAELPEWRQLLAGLCAQPLAA